jgi:type II secretory pathway component GspD/PulD (secretin)
MNDRVKQPRENRPGATSAPTRWRALACLGLALSVSQLVGCAQKAAQSQAQELPSGEFGKAVVLSARPKQDSAAFQESQDQLSDADWRKLEQLGPRPMWEQLEAKRPPRRMGDPHTSPEAQGTRPSTTQPTGSLALNESELPVQTVDMPDGKVRLIWTLRSFGGATVKSTRDATTARRTVEIAPADLTPLVAVLSQNLGQGAVTPLPRENAIVVTCDKAMRVPVLSMLNDLDRPPRQVEIAAKIFEVSRDFDFQQGTELVLNRLASDPAASLTSTFSARRFLDALQNPTPAPVQGSVLKLMQAFQSAGVSVDVSFQLLAEAGLIQVVSEPRMTVAVGQTGYMLAGQEIPIQSTNVINNVLQVGTTYKPVGVQLYITPEAAGSDRVKLHTISIVSAVSGFSPVPTMNGGVVPLVNPVIDSREAETAVTVDDGSTLVISGLRMIRTTTRENKIPGLGDVPVLGWLFKNHRSQQQQTDLYFFITPNML